MPQSPPKKPTGPNSDALLEKALYRKKRVKDVTDIKMDGLAENIVDRINERKSGSSRVASENSHDLSDVDKMTYGILQKLPKQYEITASSQSGESKFAEAFVPVDASPRSDTTGTSLGSKFCNLVVNDSVIRGEDSIKSGASSLAEEFVAKSIPYALQSTKTGESSIAEMMVAKSVLEGQHTQTTISSFAENILAKSMYDIDTKSGASSIAENVVQNGIYDAVIDDQSSESSFIENFVAKSIIEGKKSQSPISTGSSLVEKIVASGFKQGEDKALSKSPGSSLAEEIVRNLSPLMSSRSAGSHLADDLMEHVKEDIDPNDKRLVKSATTKTGGSIIASDITNKVIKKVEE